MKNTILPLAPESSKRPECFPPIEEQANRFEKDLKTSKLESFAFFLGCQLELGMTVPEALLETVENLVRQKHGFIKPLRLTKFSEHRNLALSLVPELDFNYEKEDK